MRLAVDDRCRRVPGPLATVYMIKATGTSSGSTPSTLEWREPAAAQNSEIWGKRTGDQKAEVVQNSEKFSEFSQLSFCKDRVLVRLVQSPPGYGVAELFRNNQEIKEWLWSASP